jgi:hypothetical protein
MTDLTKVIHELVGLFDRLQLPDAEQACSEPEKPAAPVRLSIGRGIEGGRRVRAAQDAHVEVGIRR